MKLIKLILATFIITSLAVGPVMGQVDIHRAFPIDTDVSLAANSDLKVPSQKAAKAYIATQASGIGAWGLLTGKPAKTIVDTGYATLAAAVAVLNSSAELTELIIPPGSHVVDADLTVNSNIHLHPMKGATIAIATTKTLTINGTLDAGRYQIFSCTGSGKVVFKGGAVNKLYPEWWTANAIPGTTDMAPALQAAFIAGQASGIPVDLVTFRDDTSNDTAYLINTGLALTTTWKNLRITGNGCIKAGAIIQMIDLDNNPPTTYSLYSQLDLQLDGNSIATGGLRIGASTTTSCRSGWNITPWNLVIHNIAGNGLDAKGCEYINIGNLDVEYCTGTGVKLEFCPQWTVSKAWLGNSAIDLHLKKAHKFSCQELLFSNNSSVTEYHLWLENTKNADISGWYESTVVPQYGQVLVSGASQNNKFNNMLMNSVNTSRDFYVIGEATGTGIEGLVSAAGGKTTVTWTNHPFLIAYEKVQIEGITQADWSNINGNFNIIGILNANTFNITFDSSTYGTPYDAGTDPGTIAAVPMGTIIQDHTFNGNTSSGKAHVNVVRGFGTRILRNRGSSTSDSRAVDIEIAESANAYDTVFEPFNPDNREMWIGSSRTLSAIHASPSAILLNVYAVNVAVTLPDATKCWGREYQISRNASSYNASILTTSSQPLYFPWGNITTGAPISNDYGFLRVRSNGTGWLVLDERRTAHGAAYPTSRLWLIGDRCIRNATSGQPVAWTNLVTGGAYASTRADTTGYSLGVWVKWSDTTVWRCTTAGTTTSPAPSIVGKVVGDTVVDGTVIWTMQSLTATSWATEGNL